MARNGPTTVIYKGTFISNQSLGALWKGDSVEEHYNYIWKLCNFGAEKFEFSVSAKKLKCMRKISSEFWKLNFLSENKVSKPIMHANFKFFIN